MSTGLVPIGFTLNFYGAEWDSLYVNNNGNVTVEYSMGTFTPFDIVATQTVLIAPFFADVDTRSSDSGVVTYGTTTYAGHNAFCVNWIDVGYYSYHTDKLNSFQLLLVERDDIAAGDFDIIFNYDKIQWETGGASGGVGGLGGSPARVGYASGGTAPEGMLASYEFPGSGVSGALLDSNAETGLINSNGGSYTMPVRSGSPEPPLAVPLVLFVEGITSAEGCGKPSPDVLNLFGYIKDQVLPDAEFRVFSYRPSGTRYADCPSAGAAWPPAGLDSSYTWSNWEASDFGWDQWPTYAVAGTCGSIDQARGHSDRFRQWYAQVTQRYENVYVLAHSMGGVVVTYALATWPGGVPENLRAVVTLDSPLQGHPNASLISYKPSGPTCEADDPAVLDLYPGSSVIQAINPPASFAWRGLVTAIANNQDGVVGAALSRLPGAWLNYRFDKGCRGFLDHSCVLRELGTGDAMPAIRESLLKPYETGTPRAVPTLAFCGTTPANVIGSPKSDLGDNRLYGSPGNDVIAALGGSDEVYGGDGIDLVCGGDGIDTLYGEGGRDSLYGEARGDKLYGGPQNDTLVGGPGLDYFDGGGGTDTCDAAGLEVHISC